MGYRIKLTLCVLFVAIGATVKAQTFSEWFRQKATQRKYLIEQIAALKAYGMVLKNGYNVSRDGLKAIGDIKDGDFNLHKDYFNSLKAVNPEISKYPRAKDIATIQQNIVALTAKNRQQVRSSGQFSSAELSYINGVYDRLQKDCLQTLSDLETVTTSGNIEMKDDERIERIDKLYKDSQSQYGFAKSFGNSLSVMSIHKKKEATEQQATSRMYGIQ